MRTLICSLLLAGCATVPKPPTPQLAQVEIRQLGVQFMGTAADETSLYICGFWRGTFSCVQYTNFMNQAEQ